MFGFVAPASGTVAIAASWTTNRYAALTVVSVYNADQTGVNSGTFINGTNTYDNSSPHTISIVNASGNMSIGGVCAESGATPTSPTQTSITTGAVSSQVGYGVSYSLTAATNDHDWTSGSGTPLSGVSVAAAGAGPTGWGALTHDRRDKLVVG